VLLEKLEGARRQARTRLTAIEKAGMQENRDDLEAHDTFLRQMWPHGHATGDGKEHFDAEIALRERRLEVELRLEVIDRVSRAVLRIGIGLAGASVALERVLG
jgi:hypothetical protein